MWAPIQFDRVHTHETPIWDRTHMEHRRVADRHVVAERRGVGPAHHVHDTSVLDVRASSNADAVDVTPRATAVIQTLLSSPIT